MNDGSANNSEVVKKYKKKREKKEYMKNIYDNDQQLSQCKKQLDKIYELLLNNQLEKQQEESKEEYIVQEAANDQAQKVELLEKMYNEKIEDVLKDVQDIKLNWKKEENLCFIDNLTPDDIRDNNYTQSLFKIYTNELSIDISKKNGRKLARLLKYLKLPNLKVITISFLISHINDINGFLQYSFPDKLQEFEFNFTFKTNRFQNIS